MVLMHRCCALVLVRALCGGIVTQREVEHLLSLVVHLILVLTLVVNLACLRLPSRYTCIGTMSHGRRDPLLMALICVAIHQAVHVTVRDTMATDTSAGTSWRTRLIVRRPVAARHRGGTRSRLVPTSSTAWWLQSAVIRSVSYTHLTLPTKRIV